MNTTKILPNGKASRYSYKKFKLEKPVGFDYRNPKETPESVCDFRKLRHEGFDVCAALAGRPEKAESLGLSTVPSSPQAKRRILHISRKARDMVESAIAIMERLYPKQCMSFLTLTLPNLAVERALRNPDKLRDAYRRFEKLLQQWLARHKLPTLIVVRPEAHPERSEVWGFAVPHWHVLFVGRKAGKSWMVSTEWVQKTWHNALMGVGLVDSDTFMDASTNMQGIKKSARRYMSKYLGKTYVLPPGVSEEQYKLLMPGTAYNVSRVLSKLVKRFTVIRSGDAGDALWDDIQSLGKWAVRAKGEVLLTLESGWRHIVCSWAFLTEAGMKTLGIV